MQIIEIGICGIYINLCPFITAEVLQNSIANGELLINMA
jgi:hypothetical protein